MRRNKGWLIALGVAAAIVATVLFDRGSPRPAPAAPKVPVTTAMATAGDVPIELEGLGRVAAFSTIAVRSQISGTISRLGFTDGQYVTRGALLAQIDPRALQASVDQDRAALARDQASLSNAQADLRRYMPLQKKGIVSAQQTDTQRSIVAQLRATLAADGAALSRDQVQLGYTTVRAPISGILGLHLVDVGNLVNPTDLAGLVTLTQIQPITALVALPQSDLDEIQARRAETGGGGLSAQAWTQDGARQLDTGTLYALSNEINPTSGTVTLKAVFPNAARRLWPGAAITVRLVLDTQHDGLTVPEDAIDQGPDGPFVWTVGQDGTATTTPVTLRQQLRGQALVTKGLHAGQLVVLDGQYGLMDHAHVEVVNPHAQQQASAANLRTNQPGELGIAP